MAGIQLKEALLHGAVEVKIIPNARKNAITYNGSFHISITAKAENNKANEMLETYLQKILGSPIKIVRGKRSSKKIIRLA